MEKHTLADVLFHNRNIDVSHIYRNVACIEDIEVVGSLLFHNRNIDDSHINRNVAPLTEYISMLLALESHQFHAVSILLQCSKTDICNKKT